MTLDPQEIAYPLNRLPRVLFNWCNLIIKKVDLSIITQRLGKSWSRAYLANCCLHSGALWIQRRAMHTLDFRQRHMVRSLRKEYSHHSVHRIMLRPMKGNLFYISVSIDWTVDAFLYMLKTLFENTCPTKMWREHYRLLKEVSIVLILCYQTPNFPRSCSLPTLYFLSFCGPLQSIVRCVEDGKLLVPEAMRLTRKNVLGNRLAIYDPRFESTLVSVIRWPWLVKNIGYWG
jgi:hypothetical protein